MRIGKKSESVIIAVIIFALLIDLFSGLCFLENLDVKLFGSIEGWHIHDDYIIVKIFCFRVLRPFKLFCLDLGF